MMLGISAHQSVASKKTLSLVEPLHLMRALLRNVPLRAPQAACQARMRRYGAETQSGVSKSTNCGNLTQTGLAARGYGTSDDGCVAIFVDRNGGRASFRVY